METHFDVTELPKIWGAPLDPEKAEMIRQLHKDSGFTISKIARRVGVSRTTVYRYIGKIQREKSVSKRTAKQGRDIDPLII